jgi:hypothetical protein
VIQSFARDRGAPAAFALGSAAAARVPADRGLLFEPATPALGVPSGGPSYLPDCEVTCSDVF